MTTDATIHRWHSNDRVALPDDELAQIHDGPILHLVINRPRKRNAITLAMWRQLSDICAHLREYSGVKLCVIRGAGGQAFSGGADIAEFPIVFENDISIRQYNEAVRLGQIAVEHLPMPTMAVIEGACMGGGCGIAMACDFRIAADTARFSIPPGKLGTAYSVADTRRLVVLVGAANAKTILCTGRTLDAAAAQAIGLITELVLVAEMDSRAAAFAASLLANSSQSIAVMKSVVNSISGVNPMEEAELDARFEASFSSRDFREGYSAFLEKRPPQFL